MKPITVLCAAVTVLCGFTTVNTYAQQAGGLPALRGDLPQLFYTRKCLGPNCQVLKVNTADNDRQVVATLDLPQGQYLVTAKAGVYLSDFGYVPGLTSIRVECTLSDAANPVVADYSSCGPVGNVYWSDTMVTMQTPASFSTTGGGTMQVACRADIDQNALNNNVTAWVWGVSIAATRVASTTIE